MALRRTVAPGEEPVTLAEAKLHCKVDGSDDDALITTLIGAARQQAEHRLQRTLVASTWVLTLDEFPAAIRLPMPRVSAVATVQYIDPDGATQTLASSGYVLDNASEFANWLLPAADAAWPDTPTDRVNSVIVTYTAGWANAGAVPAELKAWIKLAVGAWYRTREAVVGDRDAKLELPRGFCDALLDPWLVPTV